MRTAGRVSYVVEKVGTSTVGYAAHGYPRQRDGERVDVFMGLRPEESFSAWRRRVDEAPVVNGVVLGGYVSVDPVEAWEFVAPESAESPVWERLSQWCRVRRGGGEFGEVPDRTRARTAFIVGTLVCDYLGRGDAADLLLAHQVASAAERIRRHEENLANARVELEEWAQRIAHEEALLASQIEVRAVGQLAPVENPVPRWRSRDSAATREGADFLMQTVGYAPAVTS